MCKDLQEIKFTIYTENNCRAIELAAKLHHYLLRLIRPSQSY